MNNANEFLVCVRCFTFNHASYIKDAMDGFAMQQTTFPFVCVIVDDASTDGEQTVINDYLKNNFSVIDDGCAVFRETDDYAMRFVRHNTNKNCYFAVYYLKYNHYSIKKDKFSYFKEFFDDTKYHALCEGDDYWIDEFKLQKQVDFLGSNPDFGLVHTEFELVKGRRNHIRPKSDVFVFPDLLIYQYGIGTATVMYRNSVYKKIPQYFRNGRWLMGDLPMWIEFSYEAKIMYMRDVTAKYRELEESASHFKDIRKKIEFINAAYEIRDFYAQKYNVMIDVYNEKYYEELIRESAHFNSREIARKYFQKAREKNKLSWRSILFYLSAEYPVVKKILDLYIKV